MGLYYKWRSQFFTGVSAMDNITYGLVMTLLGMSGTIVSLWIISLAMNILKWLFPYQPEKKEEPVGE
jgi:hypothetical protein